MAPRADRHALLGEESGVGDLVENGHTLVNGTGCGTWSTSVERGVWGSAIGSVSATDGYVSNENDDHASENANVSDV